MSSTLAMGEQTGQQEAAASTHRGAACTAQRHTCKWRSELWNECSQLSPHSLENKQMNWQDYTSVWASVIVKNFDHTQSQCTYQMLYIGPAVLLYLVWCPNPLPGPQEHKSNHSLQLGGCQWTQSHHPVDTLIARHPSSTTKLLV